VFIGGDGGPESEGDLAADPIQKVLPQVIEGTNRVLVGNGDLDMIIISNGEYDLTFSTSQCSASHADVTLQAPCSLSSKLRNTRHGLNQSVANGRQEHDMEWKAWLRKRTIHSNQHQWY
jgi:hypothetical protein